MTNEQKEAIKNRLKSAEKRFQCTGGGQKFTVLVSLSCYCGGQIQPLQSL
ncbi:hypothetical protein [Brevibacillus sp. Leaf182]|nr:hypothetical protein [Brevibacillus sp. Leaf182]